MEVAGFSVEQQPHHLGSKPPQAVDMPPALGSPGQQDTRSIDGGQLHAHLLWSSQPRGKQLLECLLEAQPTEVTQERGRPAWTPASLYISDVSKDSDMS